MTAHLTHEELTEQLLGTSSLTVNAHLLSCPACTNELDRLKSSISSFRGAAQAWSEDHRVVEKKWSRAQSVARWPGAGWVMVAAALILFVAGSAVYRRQERIAGQAQVARVKAPVATSRVSQSQLDQDNQLLSEVNLELGESVPSPMQPLLVSESGTSGAVTNK